LEADDQLQIAGSPLTLIAKALKNECLEKEEKAILEKIIANRKKKITIIISHRLSAMKLADRILTLDNGRILETDFQYLAGKGKNE